MLIIIVNQILKMLVLLLLGIFCFKFRIIDQQGSEILTNLLLTIINPLVALMALQTEYSPALVKGLLLSFLLAFITHAGMLLLSTVLISKRENVHYAVEHFSSMYSNCGFIGIPLISSIFGGEGVLYLTAYMVTFNFFAFTQGVALMTGKTSFKSFLKGMKSPMIIACTIGLILYFCRIMLPSLIGDSLNYVSGMNTPLAMLIAGVSVAQVDIKGMLAKWKIYYISVIKLLIMPACVLGVLMLIPAPRVVAYTILIASACPTAATCTAFSIKYHKDYRYASELYTFTTLLSLLTIPLFIYLADLILVS